MRRLPLLVLALWPGLTATADVADPAALLAAQRASRLGGEARWVEDLDLDARLATVHLERGWVFPVLTPDGEATPEVVFRGAGRLRLAPTDEVERAQLELFTEEPELDEAFTEAVFVVAEPAARTALFAAAPRPPEAREEAAARALHERWRGCRERVLLGVPGSLWRIGLGEPLFADYFAGYFATENHGQVLYLVDPEAQEQVTLGRFVPLELDRKEERKARRLIHREQRQGRLLGLDLEDLGTWDTWVSAALARPGAATFEPRHYGLTVAVSWAGEVQGRAEVELTATAGEARTVVFSVDPQTEVTAVRSGSGADLPVAREETSVVVLLPAAPAAGETTTVTLDFTNTSMDLLKSPKIAGDIRYLPDTIHWYPHTGNLDRATYEVDLTTESGTLVAPGGGADAKPGKTGHYRLTRPTFGFTFEVGSFKFFTDTQGEIPITVYTDSQWRSYAQLLAGETRKALDYLQEIFGPYPYDRLTVVTAPRDYSQSFAGHLVLADDMLDSRWGDQDPRTVIAHELAHQWWGHQADFSSYRDQWLSEALANYASVQYGREKLDRRNGQFASSPTQGWQDLLTQLTATGVPLESLGPVALGGRLDSSIADAYVPIVYLKGALIVDLLHNLIGEELFLTALRKILVAPESRDLTTAKFLNALERHSNTDLKDFAERFVYGVGLPEIYYSYRFETLAEGKWAVVGRARQQAPYHYRYQVRAKESGLPDVVRTTVEKGPIARDASVAVPVEIGIFQVDGEPPSRKLSRAEKKDWEEKVAREGNAILRGRTLLKGADASFRFETSAEPRMLWFDRHEEVFCVFYDERRFPKRTAFYRGIDHAAAGRVAEAEEAFREALTVPVTTDPEPADDGPFARRYRQLEVDWLNRSIHLRLARLLLDDQRLNEAKAELERCREGDRTRMPLWQKHEERTLEARVALREGQPGTTLKLLSGNFVKRQVESREAQALLAVAAWAVGDAATLAEARKAAEKAGVDLSVLDQAPPPGRQ